MKSASSTPITQPLNRLPEDPPNGVTGGLDWARDDHAVSVVDARGREVVRHSVEHSAAGLAELVDVLTRAKVREVAIERPDGPVVQALHQHHHPDVREDAARFAFHRAAGLR